MTTMTTMKPDELPEAGHGARAGEARRPGNVSFDDISSGRRGGLRSHRGAQGRTFAQLYEEARRRGLRGRSKMNKAQLERAVGR